ncbi:monovalent cation/H+ antiporter complex subunit F [Kitasatospora sp. NRRL B-11411]|uniref:monovalent cation/H+ antiporter complex subunit F n=1 Tax=Kitasatospora sp. NRRL B-11411 TaxID=1463822 RepID=UPI000690068F|nr:monovalent cation/H+ antiporter complex subunit F [Kitasatospora sp. NRRL B-11411]
MNGWLIAATVDCAALAPCLYRCAVGAAEERLAALTLAGTVLVALFLLLAQGLDRPSYTDLALVLATLAPAGTLVFTRLLAGEPHQDHARPSEPSGPSGPPRPSGPSRPSRPEEG